MLGERKKKKKNNEVGELIIILKVSFLHKQECTNGGNVFMGFIGSSLPLLPFLG